MNNILNLKKVPTILKKGSVISTMLDSSYVWQKNIIEQVNSNIVYISLLDCYVSSLIMQGTEMTLKFTTEYYEYIFHGIVSSISLNNHGHVAITISKIEEKINARAFTRYDIYLPSNIKLENGKTSYFSIVTNISLKGMSFTSNHEFNYDDKCKVNIHLPDMVKLNLCGSIRRKILKGTFVDYGMHFYKIPSETAKNLSDYIMTLENGNQKLHTVFSGNND